MYECGILKNVETKSSRAQASSQECRQKQELYLFWAKVETGVSRNKDRARRVSHVLGEGYMQKERQACDSKLVSENWKTANDKEDKGKTEQMEPKYVLY